jgi:hypothetical protein
VHLQVRIAAQLFNPNKRLAVVSRSPFFGAAILATAPGFLYDASNR